MPSTSTVRALALAVLLTLGASAVGATAATAGPTGAGAAHAGRATPAQRDSILRLYRAYFLRSPDADGHTFWADQLAAGHTTLPAISQFFSLSDEFRARYGALDNARFVDLIYGNVLGRTPDRAGSSYWVGRLNRGSSRGSVMLGFSESPEFQRRTGTRAPEPVVPWTTQMLDAVNAQRAAHGIGPVRLCAALGRSAQAHASDMAARRVLSHTGGDGSDPGWRIEVHGYRWSTWGENVAKGGDGTVAQVMAGWMASASHKANLLDRRFVHLGLGHATDSGGSHYWTQDFGAGGAC